MLNFDFLGDFMQGMIDMLMPVKKDVTPVPDELQDERIDGTPDDPSPEDRDTAEPDYDDGLTLSGSPMDFLPHYPRYPGGE